MDPVAPSSFRSNDVDSVLPRQVDTHERYEPGPDARASDMKTA